MASATSMPSSQSYSPLPLHAWLSHDDALSQNILQMTHVVVTECPNYSTRRLHTIDNTSVIKLVTNEQVTTTAGM
eukprot:14217868-Ditylum_brightwellii.AAC.1